METRTEYGVPPVPPEPQYKQFLLRLPAALHQQLKEAAEAERRTMTQFINMAIEEKLAKTKGVRK